jgi:hypothetical protein
MKSWHTLSKKQTFVAVLILMFIIPFAPEMAMILDWGGIEMLVTCLFLYFKPLLDWLGEQLTQLRYRLYIAKQAIAQSALLKPKTFAVHAVACSCVMALTGSLLLSAVFLFPMMAGQDVLA